VQALIAAGAAAEVVDHDLACRLWAGEEADLPGGSGIWLRTEHGAPLGEVVGDGRRLRLPSRLRRSGLV